MRIRQDRTQPDRTVDARQGKARLGMTGRYGQATYAIVCQEDQKRPGRLSAMLRTRVFLVPS